MKIRLKTTEDKMEFITISMLFKDYNVNVRCGELLLDGKSIIGIFSLEDEILDVEIVTDDTIQSSKFAHMIEKYKVM